jgi:hypothetical protein
MLSVPRFQVSFARFLSCTVVLLAFAGMALAQQPADSSPETSAPKAKKVWTEDNLQPSGGPPAAAAKRSSPTSPATKDGNAQLAKDLHGKLEKLNMQLKDTDKQIDDLKRFQAGETNGDAGRQVNKGLNRMPIAQQLEKLQAKHDQLQAQISAIYDEARQKGIPPGQLR